MAKAAANLPCPVCNALVECSVDLEQAAPSEPDTIDTVRLTGAVDAAPLYEHIRADHPQVELGDVESETVPLVDRRETKPVTDIERK